MNGEVVKKRGRPATIDKKSVFELLERHIEDIFHEQSDALVGKSQLIWTTLAREFQHRILPSTIYIYACEFKKELKSNQDEGGAANEIHLMLQSDANSTVNEANSTINNSSLVLEDQKLHLEIPLEKSVFMAMTERCKVKCAGRRGGYRNKVRFIPGKYTDTIFENIFDETSLRCAFMISDTHLALNYNGGYIKGSCKCGSDLRINLDFDKNPKQVVLDCIITLGTLKGCGKLLLRKEKRMEVAEILQHKTTEKYRAELGKKQMVYGDTEPPNFYSAHVLRQAKYERALKQYLDRDPMKALAMMAYSCYESEIQVFCYKPFFLIYWINPQMQLYREYCNKVGSYVTIDASGGFTKPIKKLYDRPSGPVFNYVMSMNCSAGKFATAQMLSESHDTDKIIFFLMTQARNAGSIPKEVATDMSRALMNAVTQAYTQFNSIEDYADYLFENSGPLPGTYIRLDNAHFIHLYSNLFKKKGRALRKFYLGALGQLIICRTKSAAKEIVKCIFTLAFSEKYGALSNGCKSEAQKAEETLEALMTENNGLDEILKKVHDTDEDDQTTDDEFQQNLKAQVEKLEESAKLTENKWSAWGAAMKKEVVDDLKRKEGTKISPYYLPDLGNYLLKHLALLPIWSCIRRDDFRYGNVPVTTTGSECHFKVLKTDVFPDLPYRVDLFVKEHIEYLFGKMNIIRAVPRCDSKPETEVESNELGPETEEPPDKTSVELIDSNRSPMLAEQTTEKCPACKDKLPFPRKCATPGCQAGIHHMMECSYPLNPGLSDEGYNQERICRNCFFERPVKKTSKRKKPTESARGKPDSIEAIIDHVPEKSKKRGKYDSREEPTSMSSFNRNDVSDGDDDDDYYDDKGDDEGDDDYHPVVKKRKGDDGFEDTDDDDSEDDTNNMPLPSKKKVQAKRDYENWMGQVDKTKSKALYLGGRKEELKDAIKFKKSHQIVTLKNGNLCGKKPIQIKGEKIYISNTCAFDSIAQLLYISICDDANLRDKIAVHEDEFLKFILYLYDRGIENDKKKDETYKKRAEILLEICALPIMKEKTDMFGIQAAHNVVGFASALTKKISTIQEIRRCSEKDCPSKQVTRPLKTLQLKDTQLADPNFHNLVESPSLVSNICHEETCIGESTGFVRAIGDILLVEVISSQDPQMMSQAVSLRNIPKRVLGPTGDGTKLRLLGAIAYTGPTKITASRRHQISHYTAVCLRNDWWYEFDDKFPLRKKNRSDGAKIVPELLIYSPLS